MSDSWINRLEIAGPAGEVEAARRALAPASPSRAGSRLRGVSFRALYRNLGGRCVFCADEISDPFDISVEQEKPPCRGTVREVYRFQQAGFEPDDLLAALSARHPQLSLVLGWVAAWNGEAASRLFHRGKQVYFQLSHRRLNAIYPDIDDDVVDSDVAFRLLVEADWAALDEVMTHWRDRVRRIHERASPGRAAVPRPAEGPLVGGSVSIDSTDHAHHWSSEGFERNLVPDARALTRLLRHMDRHQTTLETFGLPDGSCMQCVGASTGYAIEIRERQEGSPARTSVLATGQPSGQRLSLRGLGFRRTVDTSQILSVPMTKRIIRQYLKCRTIPEGLTCLRTRRRSRSSEILALPVFRV